MKTLLAILTLTFVMGCANHENSSRVNMQRMKGHITLVAGGADFVVTHPTYQKFQAPKHCFPESVWDYVKAQPSHVDGSSLDMKGNTAWVDASGYIESSPPNGKAFVATEIHQIHPAHPRYLTWRRSFGSGKHVPGYVE
jgi:hypothetical protein